MKNSIRIPEYGDAYIRLRKYRDAIEVLEKVLELSRPEAVIYEAIGHCYDKLGQFAQARFNYKKASHLNPEDSQMYYKVACTYMNEGSWNHAIKSLESALRIHLMQPEYNLAIGRCYMALDKLDETITYLGNVIRVRPVIPMAGSNSCTAFTWRACLKGWNMPRWLFSRPIPNLSFFISAVSSFFETGKTKGSDAAIGKAMNINPKFIKQIIEIKPELLPKPTGGGDHSPA